MATVTLNTLDGGDQEIPRRALQELANAVGDALLFPGDTGYDESRTLWNGMYDRRPGLIVRCTKQDHVQAAVAFAADNDLMIAVHGGGHSIAANSVSDDGLLIDLSAMKDVVIDPASRRVSVGAGALLADVDAATQEHGLAVPFGINSTTGVAGLTLGGGYGWLSRRYGLTIDNLQAVDIVTVDGKAARASHTENPDLFWAIRGGSGNFGVVTRFEFTAHPVGPEVLSGLIVHPAADAAHLLRQYRDLTTDFPDDLSAWVVLRKAPPLPFLPEDWHGKEVLIFACCWAGEMEAGKSALAGLRALGSPIADVIGPHPYQGWQQAFDPLLTSGARNYWKSHNFAALSDGLIDLFVESLGCLPSPECEIFIPHLGGATKRIDPASTAFAHRGASFLMNVHTRWREPTDDTACIAWARELFDRAAQYATGGVYANFTSQDDSDRAKSAFGSSYDRLAALKAKYDPQNRLRLNMNVRPAA